MPLFRGLNPGEPDREFITVENSEGAVMLKDQTAQFDTTTDADGVKARDMDTGSLYAFIGIVDNDIEIGDKGLVQTKGYRSTSIVHQTNTTQAAGIPLVPAAGANHLISAVTTYATNGLVTQQPFFAVLMESVSTFTTTGSRKVFLRGM